MHIHYTKISQSSRHLNNDEIRERFFSLFELTDKIENDDYKVCPSSMSTIIGTCDEYCKCTGTREITHRNGRMDTQQGDSIM